MITLTREEAQQVLDALRWYSLYAAKQARETLRARLAQPEPPCKTGSQCIGGKCPQCVVSEWQGLTDEEVVKLKMQGRDLEFVSMTALHRFARDIEAKLKEKNNG